MAAVMALKFYAKAPKGASTSVATPVMVNKRETGQGITRGAHDRHTWQVLRCHGDHKQWQSQTDKGCHTELGCDKHRLG